MEYKILRFDDVAEALKNIRNQFLSDGIEGLVWKGPDKLHSSVSAGSPEPSWHFSKEGLEYHEENGRDFWDVYTMVSFQLGFHNGTVKEEKTTKIYEVLVDAYKERILTLENRKI